jgi:hypothetical protein
MQGFIKGLRRFATVNKSPNFAGIQGHCRRQGKQVAGPLATIQALVGILGPSRKSLEPPFGFLNPSAALASLRKTNGAVPSAWFANLKKIFSISILHRTYAACWSWLLSQAGQKNQGG